MRPTFSTKLASYVFVSKNSATQPSARTSKTPNPSKEQTETTGSLEDYDKFRQGIEHHDPIPKSNIRPLIEPPKVKPPASKITSTTPPPRHRPAEKTPSKSPMIAKKTSELTPQNRFTNFEDDYYFGLDDEESKRELSHRHQPQKQPPGTPRPPEKESFVLYDSPPKHRQQILDNLKEPSKGPDRSKSRQAGSKDAPASLHSKPSLLSYRDPSTPRLKASQGSHMLRLKPLDSEEKQSSASADPKELLKKKIQDVKAAVQRITAKGKDNLTREEVGYLQRVKAAFQSNDFSNI